MRRPTKNSAGVQRAVALGGPFLLLALSVAEGPAGAEDGVAADKPTVRKSQEQLHFELPPDWPIEKRAGMVGPIPVEEYLAMKFKSLEARLQSMEQKLNGMDVRLRVMEENQKGKPSQPGLRSTGTVQP